MNALFENIIVDDDIELPAPTNVITVEGDTGHISVKDHLFVINNEYLVFSTILDRLLFILSNKRDRIKLNKFKNKFIFDLDKGIVDFTYDQDITIINDYKNNTQLVIHNHDVGPLSSRRYILLLDYLSEIIRNTDPDDRVIQESVQNEDTPDTQ